MQFQAKTLGVALLLITPLLINAQSGWVQTQINPGIGYSLTLSGTTLFASTYDGVFTTETDGMPWFSKGLANHAVYDMAVTPQSWLAATVDGIYRSADKGVSWTLMTGSPKCSGVGGTKGNKVLAIDGTKIYYISWANGLYRSDDDGKTWQLLTVGTVPGSSGDIGGRGSGIYTLNGRVFLAAIGGDLGIWYSDDGGKTWSGAKSAIPSAYGNFLFFKAQADTLYSGGFSGLYRSINKGANWIALSANTTDNNGQLVGMGTFRDMAVYKKSLIAAIDFKSIRISNDDGKTWNDFNQGLITDWTFAALAVNPPYVWALNSFFGNAYRRRVTSVVTGVVKPLQLTLDIEWIRHNSAGNTVDVYYLVNEPGKTNIAVFDIYGREVGLVQNNDFEAGSHQVQLPLTTRVPGTYFCRLQCGPMQKVVKFYIQ